MNEETAMKILVDLATFPWAKYLFHFFGTVYDIFVAVYKYYNSAL